MTKKCNVKKVEDADTFKTSCDTRPIRISGVDAYESNTNKGQAAKKFVKGLIEGKEIKYEQKAIDKYNRIVADVQYKDNNGKWQDLGTTLKKKGFVKK